MSRNRKTAKPSTRTQRPVRTPVLVDRLLDPLVRIMELRVNLQRERTQEANLLMLQAGIHLPIAATRRAAMLERAINRQQEAMFNLPL